MERRVLTYEFRASKRNDKMVVAGYAARYNTLSHRMSDGMGGQFRERIAKGAFNKILRANPDCVALLNHNANYPLGRTTSGTLELEGDDDGLGFSCDLPETSYGRDLYESVKRGDMNACSFAFNLDGEDQSFDEEEDPETRGKKVIVRTIKNFRALYDISIVTNPAYPGTSVDARGLEVIGAEVRSVLKARRKPNWGSKRLPPGKSMEDMAADERARKAADASVIARRKALLHSIL